MAETSDTAHILSLSTSTRSTCYLPLCQWYHICPSVHTWIRYHTQLLLIWTVDPINGQYLQYSVKPPVSTKPFGRAGRSIGFGRVSGVVRSEVNTGARGSSKKTGTEFTWSCESDATTSLRSRYWFPLSGWETLRSRIVDIQLTCLAVLLASYLFTLGPALTWVRHCVTQLCDFQQNYFKPSCSLLLGGCFMCGWGSKQWYEIPGFAEQPIWS